MDPDFLRAELETSRRRLGRVVIDGFLLHNPEHFYDQSQARSADDFYATIERAFAALEEQVHSGTIRYYGSGSNTLPLATDEPTATDVRRLLGIAERLCAEHHFRIIEFPFNLIENQALTEHQGAPA